MSSISVFSPIVACSPTPPFTRRTAKTISNRVVSRYDTTEQQKIVWVASWTFSAYMLFNRPVFTLLPLGVALATKLYCHPSPLGGPRRVSPLPGDALASSAVPEVRPPPPAANSGSSPSSFAMGT